MGYLVKENPSFFSLWCVGGCWFQGELLGASWTQLQHLLPELPAPSLYHPAVLKVGLGTHEAPWPPLKGHTPWLL